MEALSTINDDRDSSGVSESDEHEEEIDYHKLIELNHLELVKTIDPDRQYLFR